MAEWGKVLSFVEIRRVNRATGDIETWYRYTCETAQGNVFSETLPESVARGPGLEKALTAKARELEHLAGK